MGRTLAVHRRYMGHETLLFKALEKHFERLRGLLGTPQQTDPVALVDCSSIHTFGMRYRIDVAFVDVDGMVLESWMAVPPGRVLTCRNAWVTLERPHREDSWPARGERVQMSWMEDEKHAERAEAGTSWAAGWNEVYVCRNACG